MLRKITKLLNRRLLKSFNISDARTIYELFSKQVLRESHSSLYRLASVICETKKSASNPFLIDLIADSAKKAVHDAIISDRHHLTDHSCFNVFPGEHYRLIKAIANLINPAMIVEVGTYTGMGTIALSQGAPSSKIYTYDIVPWNQFSTHLSEQNFSNGYIKQILGDLSDPNFFALNLQILNQAQLIFVDAPKDGEFEYKFLPQLEQLSPMENRILILDDIRFLNMVSLWNAIQSPKLDATSFGHWSGTGIVDISRGLVMN